MMSALDDLFDGHYFTEDPHVYIPIDEAQQELADLRTENERLKAEREWQPIKTAPIKPEGDYLGFQCGEVFKMYWNYFRDGWVDCYSEVFSEPSHWMPLPKPPEEK